MTEPSSPGRVRSVVKSFALLEALAAANGSLTLSSLATRLNQPVPTTHRLLKTLSELGYVTQTASREYALGLRVLSLRTGSITAMASWTVPILQQVVDSLGESANLAVLDADQMVYVAQVPSPHSMRTFTEVGRAVAPHCTAVGKAVLAGRPAQTVLDLLNRVAMSAATEFTITDPALLIAQLDTVRQQGYALDDQEQEVGVRCVAVAVPIATSLAISVSGPLSRMSDDLVARAVPILQQAAERLAGAATN